MRLILPLPPSLNEMIDLAKQRDRRGRPTVYASTKQDYWTLCDLRSREAGIFPPREPWQQWAITSTEFYVWNPRDLVELFAGLKWPVDWLVKRGFVANDSPRELIRIVQPHQVIDRQNQRVEMEIVWLTTESTAKSS